MDEPALISDLSDGQFRPHRQLLGPLYANSAYLLGWRGAQCLAELSFQPLAVDGDRPQDIGYADVCAGMVTNVSQCLGKIRVLYGQRQWQ